MVDGRDYRLVLHIASLGFYQDAVTVVYFVIAG
jgi:hypothetical protein